MSGSIENLYYRADEEDRNSQINGYNTAFLSNTSAFPEGDGAIAMIVSDTEYEYCQIWYHELVK